MEVIIERDADAASLGAARLIARLMSEKPNAVLGLASGSTPLRLYQQLVRMHVQQGLDCSQLTTFHLDEYVGLGPDHPQSCRHFMDEHLFRRINVPREHTHVPDGLSADIAGACELYERAIAATGGIDLQVLGLDADGQIGFNEPTSSLASRTRIKALAPRTLASIAPFFGGDVSQAPQHCITMGIGTILEARRVVVLAFGKDKAEAAAAMIEGPVAAIAPASVLQHHATVKVFLDEGAASQLKRGEYYRWAYRQKPAWQANA